ncbi:hypothetical protein QBC36DRAFT_121748 [Triangularia setosa]|uniref:Uncharacterized protein n=1 Tax=Triangularia setosa TaxID=2587417 RepID=A0AAN6WH68_9PEZI|nr:hypothetical protein QBC36DRAFT_121748 [Podospora setosa]
MNREARSQSYLRSGYLSQAAVFSGKTAQIGYRSSGSMYLDVDGGLAAWDEHLSQLKRWWMDGQRKTLTERPTGLLGTFAHTLPDDVASCRFQGPAHADFFGPSQRGCRFGKLSSPPLRLHLPCPPSQSHAPFCEVPLTVPGCRGCHRRPPRTESFPQLLRSSMPCPKLPPSRHPAPVITSTIAASQGPAGHSHHEPSPGPRNITRVPRIRLRSIPILPFDPLCFVTSVYSSVFCSVIAEPFKP